MLPKESDVFVGYTGCPWLKMLGDSRIGFPSASENRHRDVSKSCKGEVANIEDPIGGGDWQQ